MLPCGYYRQKMRINYELQELLVIRGVYCCCDRGIWNVLNVRPYKNSLQKYHERTKIISQCVF
jgi:hypothetical protein